MILEIRHLKMVEAIAKEKGVTRAALCLNISQSALSHQLREIEDRLQVPLFLRVKKRMILTEAGERLLACSTIVMKELQHAEEEIRRIAGALQ